MLDSSELVPVPGEKHNIWHILEEFFQCTAFMGGSHPRFNLATRAAPHAREGHGRNNKLENCRRIDLSQGMWMHIRGLSRREFANRHTLATHFLKSAICLSPRIVRLSPSEVSAPITDRYL